MHAIISWILYGNQPKKLQAEVEELRLKVANQKTEIKGLTRSRNVWKDIDADNEDLIEELHNQIEELEDASWDDLITHAEACKLLRNYVHLSELAQSDISNDDWRTLGERLLDATREFLETHE